MEGEIKIRSVRNTETYELAALLNEIIGHGGMTELKQPMICLETTLDPSPADRA